jgi:hypothetical protein
LRSGATDPGDDADVLVPHDLRAIVGATTNARVAATHAAGLDPQQRGILADFRKR